MTKKESVHREAEAPLTEQLRALFETVADQPVPGEIMDLVEALEEKRRYREDSGDDS